MFLLISLKFSWYKKCIKFLESLLFRVVIGWKIKINYTFCPLLQFPIKIIFFLSPLSFNFWQLHCHNFFFSTQISATWLPQVLLNFLSPLPYNFVNLVATIPFFLSGISLIWTACILGRNFGNITKIQFYFFPSVTSFLSSLILSLRISATPLPKFISLLIFLNNFKQCPYHK